MLIKLKINEKVLDCCFFNSTFPFCKWNDENWIFFSVCKLIVAVVTALTKKWWTARKRNVMQAMWKAQNVCVFPQSLMYRVVWISLSEIKSRIMYLTSHCLFLYILYYKTSLSEFYEWTKRAYFFVNLLCDITHFLYVWRIKCSRRFSTIECCHGSLKLTKKIWTSIGG